MNSYLLAYFYSAPVAWFYSALDTDNSLRLMSDLLTPFPGLVNPLLASRSLNCCRPLCLWDNLVHLQFQGKDRGRTLIRIHPDAMEGLF